MPVLSHANLARYQAVVFLNPSGEVFDSAQKAAFRKFIRNGKGFVGLHNATAYVLEGWGRYDSLVCARYESEIHSPSFRLAVVEKNHPSTSALPSQWSLDEADMGSDHPYSWYHAYDGGRAWCTAGGSSAEAFSDSLFLLHLAGGIKYAIGGPGTGLRDSERTLPRTAKEKGAGSPVPRSPVFSRPGRDGFRFNAQGRSERARPLQNPP